MTSAIRGRVDFSIDMEYPPQALPPRRLPERFVDLKGGKSVYLEVL